MVNPVVSPLIQAFCHALSLRGGSDSLFGTRQVSAVLITHLHGVGDAASSQEGQGMRRLSDNGGVFLHHLYGDFYLCVVIAEGQCLCINACGLVL